MPIKPKTPTEKIRAGVASVRVLPKEIGGMPADHSFGITQIARIYNLSKEGVWEAIRDGRLKGYRSDALWLVTRTELIRAFESQTFPTRALSKPPPNPNRQPRASSFPA